MNSTVGPIFNESLVKKEVYGSYEQCMKLTGKDRNALQKKKKKKRPKRKRSTLSLVSKWILNIPIFLINLFKDSFGNLYIFFKGRQDNKLCFLKKFDF